jgi:hypothetical protein
LKDGSLRDSDDEVLRGCLERALGEAGKAPAAIVGLSRRPFAYETSFAIEALDVRLGDGSELRLLAKDVGGAGLSAAAAGVKPPFLAEPGREIAVYRDLLDPAALSTPRYYGATTDEDEDRWWLFLERVEGEALTDVGALSAWRQTAAWAALLDTAAGAVAAAVPAALLVQRDRAWHERWIDAAIALGDESGPASEAGRRLSERLRAGRDAFLDRLDALPRAFVHGELYPSNVVVAETEGRGARIAPVDWELAGTGPYALDLAALVSGWGSEEQLSMCRAFHESLVEGGGDAPVFAELLAAVSLCRLTLALQWIGWARGWRAPEAHRHDWVAEALELLDEVGLG